MRFKKYEQNCEKSNKLERKISWNHGTQIHIFVHKIDSFTDMLFEVDQYLLWVSDEIFACNQMPVIFWEYFLIRYHMIWNISRALDCVCFKCFSAKGMVVFEHLLFCKYAYPELRPRVLLRSDLWPQTKILQKFLEKEKGHPFTFSWFQSCCGWRLRLTASRKFAVAVAVGIFDRNSGYVNMSICWNNKNSYNFKPLKKHEKIVIFSKFCLNDVR